MSPVVARRRITVNLVATQPASAEQGRVRFEPCGGAVGGPNSEFVWLIRGTDTEVA
jgi:hypothetical protein